jgi:hypothetical protein
MSQLAKAVFGATALSLMLGAVQFASGRDLGLQDTATTVDQSGTSLTINRVAKADRAERVAGPTVSMRTVSLRLTGLTDMSVLMQVPVVGGTSAPSSSTPGLFLNKPMTKATVACEPMVSVLTDVAKLLQPGRCVT